MTRHALLRLRPGGVKMKGLRRALLARYRAAEDPENPYRLPTYRDPQARRRAREARVAAA